MKTWRSSVFLFASLGGALTIAYLLGYHVGNREGYRRNAIETSVKYAANLTGELLALRRHPETNSTIIDRQERLLESCVSALAHRTSPQDLARNGSLMRAMHSVKRYRQVFPYSSDMTWAQTNRPYLSPSAHADVKSFLQALPEPDENTSRRLNRRLSQTIGSHRSIQEQSPN